MYNDLMPPYDFQKMPAIVTPNVSYQNAPLDSLSGLRQLDNISGLRGNDVGSNNWVISGQRTTTGKPLLANDPHLGIQMPSIWYFNSLHCQPVSADCPYDVTGASFAGMPGVVIGHNARIAWGVTNVGPDVQDLFLEKIDGNQYEYKGQKLDLAIVPETFVIKGKLPADYKPSLNETAAYDEQSNTTTITLNVRSTVHGPLISDVDGDAAQAGGDLGVAFSWTAINAADQVMGAVVGIDRAQNWDEYRAALSKWQRAQPELRLRRCGRQHRLSNAGPHSHSRQGRRATARAGLDGRIRLDRLPSRSMNCRALTIRLKATSSRPTMPSSGRNTNIF